MFSLSNGKRSSVSNRETGPAVNGKGPLAAIGSAARTGNSGWQIDNTACAGYGIFDFNWIISPSTANLPCP
jgi:hypothetical protein